MKSFGVFIVSIIRLSVCFNVSPTPNIIIPMPTNSNLKLFHVQTRSSYFGLSITVQKQNVFIGAPRTPPTHKYQKYNIEPGEVFKYNLKTKICTPFDIEKSGNKQFSDTKENSEKLRHHKEMKTNRTLGAALDSFGDRLVACAPSFILTHLIEMNIINESIALDKSLRVEDFDMPGICYLINDTTKLPLSKHVSQIEVSRLKKDLERKTINETLKDFEYAECGFSVHMTDNQEVLLGCPGTRLWTGSILRQKINMEERDIPVTKLNDIPNFSYFGYAVSSAYFLGPGSETLFYVASAPRAEELKGKVLIFTINSTLPSKKKVETVHTFTGLQMGEYFGYTLLTEDFNNDGFPDLAVSAPLKSKNGSLENGAVYIFINDGNMAFKEPMIITNDYESNGRFGTALSKLGDLNLDGFNDIAISAPFEGDGAVYIHLGGPDGISAKPSQRLQSPSNLPTPYGDGRSAMFGHGISRGVDIDSNGYPDIAIGSPNSEVVYIYKSYPVVNVIASIQPSKTELSLDDTKFNMKVCAFVHSRMPLGKDIKLSMTVSLDMQYNRASFSPKETQKVQKYEVDVSNNERCTEFVIELLHRATLPDISRPITIVAKYDTVDKIPENSQKFCSRCVALDPHEGKSVSTKVTFSTGCEHERCTPDLRIVGTLMNVSRTFMEGNRQHIEIQYEISNTGESSYLTQLKISIPTNVTQFSRVPAICREENNKRDMICDINQDRHLANGESTKIDVSLESLNLDIESFKVLASVTTSGDELKPADNECVNEIILTKFSDVEVVGQSSSKIEHLGKNSVNLKLNYSFTLTNNGPSTIKELIVSIFFPTHFIGPVKENIAIVGSMTSECSYKGEICSPGDVGPAKDQFKNAQLHDDLPEELKFRNIETHGIILFDCSNHKQIKCDEIRFSIMNFIPGEQRAKISLNFTINSQNVYGLFTDHLNVSVFRTTTKLQRAGDEDFKTLKATISKPFTILQVENEESVPIWIYIASSIFGLMALLLLAFAMRACGFFKRLRVDSNEESSNEGSVDCLSHANPDE